MTSENPVLDEGTPAPVADKKAPYVDERTGITIDPSRDESITEFARATLTGFYMDQEETVQERYSRAAKCYSSNPEHAQRLYDAVSKGYFMFASPPLSNATLPGEKMRGLPISCFLNEPDDTVAGLIEHLKETEWLTVMGGGVGGFWNTRSESLKSSGLTPFQNVIDSLMGAFSQGVTRRGSYASYVRVDHPNFPEFLTIRTPTGDEGRKCHGTGYHHGAVIPNAFMKAVEADGDWDLIDPHSKEVKKTVKARELWEQMLDVRYRTGEPYMFFEENAQAGLHPALKAKGLSVKASNLCSEIMLPTTPDRTAVCCLSSLNCETADEWPPTLIPDLIEMLDNILTIFIENAPSELWRAVASAKAERSVGLGLMGFHSYLQKNGIPFESQKARDINIELFHRIKAEAEAASLVLGGQRGEPEDLKGTGRRNAHLIAIAPNANSGILLGTSPSIEPSASNAYVHRTRAGSFPVQNKHLMALLEIKGKNTPDVWKLIINSKGSVQELPFLTDDEKSVYKTASELDQKWIVIHAADRQPYVCQGQSVNLFFPAGYDRNKFSYVHWLAWKKGLKSLYYVRTVAGKRADNLSTQAERFEHATYKKEGLHKRVWKGIKRMFVPRVDWSRKGETEDEKALNVDQELFENEQPQPIVVAGCAINGDQIEVGGKTIELKTGSIYAKKIVAKSMAVEKIDKSKDDIWAKAESGQESSCTSCEG